MIFILDLSCNVIYSEQWSMYILHGHTMVCTAVVTFVACAGYLFCYTVLY